VKKILSAIKPYFRWVILGVTLFFVAGAFKDNWSSIATIQIGFKEGLILAIALIVTLFAHIWSGLVWVEMLRGFQQPIRRKWALQVYLTTNLGKYLPGNIGHFYGRISAIRKIGSSLEAASLSVLLEPLLMAAAAFFITIFSCSLGLIETKFSVGTWIISIFLMTVVLGGIHPKIINSVIQFLSKAKKKEQLSSFYLKQYPLVYLFGEIGFLLFRGLGFLLVWMAFNPINLEQIPILFSVFSCAWLLGLIVPGAPGGLGVFEATAIALLSGQNFPDGVILSTIALFRIISILAEAIAASLAWLMRFV
jgi:glycosyltransferase 2 family protein